MNKKFLKWAVVNIPFLSLAIIAYVINTPYATQANNVFLFAIWAIFSMTLLALIGTVALNVDVNKMSVAFKQRGGPKMSQTNYDNFKNKYKHNYAIMGTDIGKPIPKWLDYSYDVVMLGILAGSGHFLFGILYLSIIICTLIVRKTFSEQITTIATMVSNFEVTPTAISADLVDI